MTKRRLIGILCAGIVGGIILAKIDDHKPHSRTAVSSVTGVVPITKNQPSVDPAADFLKSIGAQSNKPEVQVREIMKEVPAKFTEEQLADLALAAGYKNAQFVMPDGTLSNIDGVVLFVDVSPAVTNLFSREQARNKVELILRQSRIRIYDKVPFPDDSPMLSISVGAFRNSSTVVFSLRASLSDTVAFQRKGIFKEASADLWASGSFGTVGIANAANEITSEVTQMTEEFANKVLSARESETK